jgi:plastocyanin
MQSGEERSVGEKLLRRMKMNGKLKRLRIGLGCAAVLVAGVSAASYANGARQKTASDGTGTQVKIDNFTFAPVTLTIPVGTTVQWVNRDDIPHTVVSDDKSTIKSKALDTDENFSYTFTKAGTYSYFCSIHPKMTGKVVVQ